MLDLPYEKPPLTANEVRRMHYMKQNTITQKLKGEVGWLAKAAGIPRLERARVGIIQSVTDRRRRDVDNIAATIKPCLDGLVQVGVLVDDHHMIVQRTWQEIELAAESGVVLVIEEVE